MGGAPVAFTLRWDTTALAGAVFAVSVEASQIGGTFRQ